MRCRPRQVALVDQEADARFRVTQAAQIQRPIVIANQALPGEEQFAELRAVDELAIPTRF